MNRKLLWLALLGAAVLVLSACGPSMVTPTPKATATAAVTALPTAVTLDVSKLRVDPNDWHALGPADAAVTLTDYSDYQ